MVYVSISIAVGEDIDFPKIIQVHCLTGEKIFDGQYTSGKDIPLQQNYTLINLKSETAF